MRMVLSRRNLLLSSAAGAVTLAAPSLSRAQSRPILTHGVQSGDVSADAAVVWARADREASMLVEWATTESFRDARQVQPLDLGPATDLSGKRP